MAYTSKRKAIAQAKQQNRDEEYSYIVVRDDMVHRPEYHVVEYTTWATSPAWDGTDLIWDDGEYPN